MFKIPKFNFGKKDTGTVDKSVPSAIAPSFETAVTNPVPELKFLDIAGGSTIKPRIDLLAALSTDTNLSRTDRSNLVKSVPGAACIVFLERRPVVTHASTAKHLKKGSQMGRILATNYKYRHSFVLPQRKAPIANKLLKTFDFSTPSPDDVKIKFFQSS